MFMVGPTSFTFKSLTINHPLVWYGPPPPMLGSAMVDSWPVLGIGPSFFFSGLGVCCFFFQGYTRELGGTNMFEHICVCQNQKFKKFHWFPFGLLKLIEVWRDQLFFGPSKTLTHLRSAFLWVNPPPTSKKGICLSLRSYLRAGDQF